MPRPLVVICCVGLTPGHLGRDTPALSALASQGFAAPLETTLPAVTTSAQTTMLTGVDPREHGVVANGWYFRELGEVWFWRQSERLVQSPLVWDLLRRNQPQVKVLKHFWWYAMNSSADALVTPRPAYHQDGAKSPDIYALPSGLKDHLTSVHGEFPLFHFWGPTASIRSTRWIAESFATAFDHVEPDLALCYLPHLDYDLQRFGPTGGHLSANLRALDAAAALVITHARSRGARVLVVSEYGIEPVSQAVFPNRTLREAKLLQVARNATGELLDPGASRAFAVCDHQLAHVYCRDAQAAAEAHRLLANLEGVERVYAGQELAQLGLDHHRSGELVMMAARGAWFAHDYWLDPREAPDFARCVEIHKKPGYDPRELVFDRHGGKRRALLALMRKKLGMRYVMSAIGADPAVVKGSHGRLVNTPSEGALLIASEASWARPEGHSWHQRDICALIQQAFA
jgi:predicted AlkP superfamily pyrophosphatase or phosphodiesterase